MISDRAIGLLGLGARARTVIVGTGRIRHELQHDRIQVLVLAADRGPRTREKVERLARAKGIPVLTGPAAETLGRRLGRGAVQAVGIVDRRLAAGLTAQTGNGQ